MTKKNAVARENTFRRGFLSGFRVALAAMKEGRTAEEIERYHDERLVEWRKAGHDGKVEDAPPFDSK